MDGNKKFRAWDKLTNQWAYTGFHIIGEVSMFGGIEEHIVKYPVKDKSFLDRLDEIIIQQWIGLKDVNGNDIYEGDIVKRHTGYVFEMKLQYFSLGGQNDAQCYGYDYHRYDEVIGNIFEK